MKWTKEQEQVITLRNRNILVSAAAGSGKTAVLVERIIQRILDKEHPVDIDRMLIVTFTAAAASEMRERIGAAIEAALEKDPENTHLQKQTTLLHHAQITTIHSFCLNLIRNYFHRIDLEPNFRIAEEGELNLLREDVIAEVLNQNYEEKTEEFLQFVECFATGKKDDALRELIFKLYHLSMSAPWPKEWLHGLTKAYQFKDMEELEHKDWMQALVTYLRQICMDLTGLAEQNLKLASDDDGPLYLKETAERDQLRIEHLKDAAGYHQMAEVLEHFAFDRLPVNRKYEGSIEKLECFKEQRDTIKSTVKKLKEDFFFDTEEEILNRLAQMAPVVTELVRLTEEFTDAFDAKKREKNILDFSDLEHFALKILLNEDTKEPTEAAFECKKLYEEVMIDEYQDSNLVQESLLSAVSKEDIGEYNRFMVGDVKQSIYRFRLARPELFMEKYDAYTSEGSNCQKIELHKNFRSRKEVLDITNHMFEKLMKRDLGNVEYDDAAALYLGAEYPQSDAMKPEILVADSKEELLEEAELTDPVALEAELVADRIKRLMREQQVTDKKTGMLRDIRYSDIVILLRSFGKYADTFMEVFEQKGIPAHATSRTGYFQTLEIQTILSLLKILDNPRQDIPLAAVLRSPIGGFSDEELARLKAAGGERSFHASVLEADQTQLEETLYQKLERFLQKLSGYRSLVTELPIHELLYYILEDSGYAGYVSAMPGGERRKANVEMLLEKAVAYEKTSYRGLFHFIRYMDRLQKYEVDYGEADVVNESADAIKLMTIHKSKGLEFPVVFVSATAKNFNKTDVRSRLVIHPDLGAGVDFIDPKQRVYGATLYKKAVAKQMELENLGEELRVLYVALTRAKEKLIITGVKKDVRACIEKLEMRYQSKDKIAFLERAGARSFLDWILTAAAASGESSLIEIWDVQKLVEEETKEQLDKAAGLGELLYRVSDVDEEADAYVTKQLSYQYPYQIETNRKVKYSVSELKHRAMEAVFEEEELNSVPLKKTESLEFTPYIPRFAGGEDTTVNQGALRGSAMHRALECLDVKTLAGSDDLEQQLEKEIIKITEKGRLTEEMRQLLRRKKLVQFYQSPLAMRMKAAAEREELFTERPFVMGQSADEIEHDGSDTMVLVQGIIDAFFIEDDEIVLLDYKTDVINSAEELKNRYQKQLDLYQCALEANLGKKVKEKLLYSFYLDAVVEV